MPELAGAVPRSTELEPTGAATAELDGTLPAGAELEAPVPIATAEL